MTWQTVSTDSTDTERLGEIFGRHIQGSQVVELRADLGGGKTTFVRGLARGLGSDATVASPTFTLGKIYKTKDLEIHHFDFYRLSEAGILEEQLEESLGADNVVTVVEWSDIVKNVLPAARLTIELRPTQNDADEREVVVDYPPESERLIKSVETDWQEVRP